MSKHPIEQAHRSVGLKRAVKKTSRVSAATIKRLGGVPAIADKLNRLHKTSEQARRVIKWKIDLGSDVDKTYTTKVRGVATYDRRNQEKDFPDYGADAGKNIIFKAHIVDETPINDEWKKQAESDGRVWVEGGKTHVELEVPVNKKFYIKGWDKKTEVEGSSQTTVVQADQKTQELPVVFYDDVEGDVERLRKKLDPVVRKLDDAFNKIYSWLVQQKKSKLAEKLKNTYQSLREKWKEADTVEKLRSAVKNLSDFIKNNYKKYLGKDEPVEPTEDQAPEVVITPAEATTKKPTFHQITGNTAQMIDDLKENTLAFDVYRQGGNGKWYYTYDIRFAYTTAKGETKWLRKEHASDLGIGFSGMKTLKGGHEELSATPTGITSAQDSDEVTQVDEHGSSIAMYETEQIYATKSNKKTVRVSFGDEKRFSSAQKLILKQEGAFGVLEEAVGEPVSVISVYVRAAVAQGKPDINSPAANATIHIYNPALSQEGS